MCAYSFSVNLLQVINFFFCILPVSANCDQMARTKYILCNTASTLTLYYHDYQFRRNVIHHCFLTHSIFSVEQEGHHGPV